MSSRLTLPSPREGTSDMPPPRSLDEIVLDDMRRKATLMLALHGFRLRATPNTEGEDAFRR